MKHSHGTKRCGLDDVRISAARMAMDEIQWRHDLVEASDVTATRLAHNAVERLAIAHKCNRLDVATASAQGIFVAKAMCGEYLGQNAKGDWIEKMPEVFHELNEKVNMSGQKKIIEELLDDLVPEDHAEIAADDRDVEDEEGKTEQSEMAKLRAELLEFREMVAELKDLKATAAGFTVPKKPKGKAAESPTKKKAKKKAAKKRGKKKT